MIHNVFASLLFTFFFVFVTYLGIASIGKIQGKDIYIIKRSSVGREA